MIRLESRPPNIEGEGEVRIRELVRNALRMRPDRIVVGEVRGAETLDMLQAMNTGHEGSLTTIHANSPRDALNRLETLVLMSGLEIPLHAIREQISSALDLVVHITRLVDGSRRISHVTEVLGMESDVITLQDIFVARAGERPRGSARLDVVPAAARVHRPPARTSSTSSRRTGVDPAGRLLPARRRAPGGRGEREARDEVASSSTPPSGPLVVGLAVGCLMLVAALVALAKPRGAWLKSRLEPYGRLAAPSAAGGPAGTHGEPAGARSVDRLFGATERALERTTRLRGRSSALLERAHVQVRPAQLLFWAVAAGVGARRRRRPR